MYLPLLYLYFEFTGRIYIIMYIKYHQHVHFRLRYFWSACRFGNFFGGFDLEFQYSNYFLSDFLTSFLYILSFCLLLYWVLYKIGIFNVYAYGFHYSTSTKNEPKNDWIHILNFRSINLCLFDIKLWCKTTPIIVIWKLKDTYEYWSSSFQFNRFKYTGSQ